MLRYAVALIIATVPTSAIAEPVSTDAVRVALTRLEIEGLTGTLAKGFTATLVDWLHAEETSSDQALGQAVTALVHMLDSGVVSVEGMASFCDIAPKCIEHLAAGGGMTEGEAMRHLVDRDWVAENALSKMFAVARNRYIAKGGQGMARVLDAQSHRVHQ